MKYDKTGSNLVDDTTVFISYSREDQDFVERLEQYLAGQSIKCFVDRTHIDKGEEWWGRIEQLISLSQKVIFVLSPDFLRSGVCKREVECAVTLNKKLLPIVYRNIDGQNVSEHLEKINYRFCDSKEISEAFTTKLVAAIHADIDWYREYERLAESARQWKKSKMATWNRLSGPAVLSAQRLIARRPVNSNPPDENTMEFVEFSHRVEVRRQRQAVAASISVAVVFMLLAVWAWLNMKETQFGQIRNIAAQAKTEAAAGKMHVPVALALEANAELKKQQWFGKLFEEWMPEFVAYAANRLSGISNPKEWFKAAKTSVGDALVDAVESAHRGALLTYMARANNTVDIRDDGSLVALAVEGNNVQLWASSGEGQSIVLSGHKDMISSVSFVCEGALVLTTSQDKTAKLWDRRLSRYMSRPSTFMLRVLVVQFRVQAPG